MTAPTDMEALGRELMQGARSSASIEQLFSFYPTLLRLLLEGRPLTVAQVATAAGIPEDEMRAALSGEPIEQDEEGRIVGAGLTLVPTPHRFRVEGRDLYAWCALDTLTFPTLLGVRAEVESPCQATRTPVHLTVTPEGVSSVEPATAVVSVVPIENAPNIRTAFCDHVHFFRSREDAREWLAAHPGGMIVSVEEGFSLGRGFARDLAGRSGDAGHSRRRVSGGQTAYRRRM